MKRTIVITGSAAGIGAATRDLLISKGDRVIGVDLHEADINIDLGSAQGCEKMVEHIHHQCPEGIDGIVANAGVIGPDTLCYDINFRAAVRTLEGLQPLLALSDRPRAVVTASNSAAMVFEAGFAETLLEGGQPRDTDVNGAAYAASKRAIALWIRKMAPSSDWAGNGILLNALCPGVTRTEMGELALKDPATQALIDATPLRRPATPDEIAALLAFLISAENSYMTGEIVFADGGYTASTRETQI